MCKWLDIADSPKYPLNVNQYGPEFIVLTKDLEVFKARWEYPHKGSTAYADNHPPRLGRNDNAGCTVNATHYMPMPASPITPPGGK